MAESSEGPGKGTGSSTRVIAIAAVLAALLALVVALGLVLRANQGDENDPSTVNPMGADSNGLPVAGDEAAEQDAAFAPPWPARRIGGNCSAGGIVAHWKVDADGAWQCTVTTPDAVAPAAPAEPLPPPPPEPAPAPAPEPVPVEAPPPPAYEPPPPPEPEPVPAPAPAPAPPPPPIIQLPFPLPPIFIPPAAAVLQ